MMNLKTSSETVILQVSRSYVIGHLIPLTSLLGLDEEDVCLLRYQEKMTLSDRFLRQAG